MIAKLFVYMSISGTQKYRPPDAGTPIVTGPASRFNPVCGYRVSLLGVVTNWFLAEIFLAEINVR